MTVRQLVQRERDARRRLAVALTAALLIAGGAALLGAGVALLGGARWIALPRATPWLVWVAGLGVAVVAMWQLVRSLRGELSATRLAGTIEAERQLRAGSLRGALEVADVTTLGVVAARRMAETLGTAPGSLAPMARRRALHRALGAAAVMLLGVGLLTAARSVRPDGWHALLHPVRAWNGSLLPPLRIGAPTEALRGESIRVVVDAPSRATVTLARRVTGTGWTTSQLPIRGSSAVVQLGPLDGDLTLVATDGRATSDTVVVRATDKAFLGDVSLRAVFPAYLQRASEALAAGEIVRVPRGTSLVFRGRASTLLRSVALTRGKDSSTFRTDGYGFEGRLAPSASGTWQWHAVGESRAIADVPTPLVVEMIPDAPPRIAILRPQMDTVVTPVGVVTLVLAADDDHGVGEISLVTVRESATGARGPEIQQQVTRAAGASWGGEVAVDLAARGLAAGDALRLTAIAVEESPWRQRGVSRELVLRVPGLAEQRERARSAGDSAVEQARSVLAEQTRLQQRTAEAAQARGTRSSATSPRDAQRAAAPPRAAAGANPQAFQDAEKARALAREQRDMTRKVEELRAAAAQLQRELQQAGALDSALSATLQDVQRLLRDALTPELQAQLAELEKAVKTLSGEEGRRALGDLVAQQRALREQLERSLQMFKRAALEGAMQTLRDEAREIAAEQRKLADTLQRSPAADARPARELERRARGAEAAAKALSSRLRAERATEGAERVTRAEAHVDRSADAMRRTASASESAAGAGRMLPESASSQAAQSASEGAQAMQQAADELADARSAQIEAWKKQLTEELDQAIGEALQLARRQGALEQSARAQGDASGVRGEQSALQQGARATSERVQEAGRRSSLLSPRAQRAMSEGRTAVERATEQVAEAPRSAQTPSAMRDAAEALNRAAAALVRDRERAGNAASASGFAEMLQQLQELARQQGALNAQAGGIPMGASGQEGGGTASAMARELARRQRALADALDSMGDADGTGRAEGLAREARRIAEALERGGMDAVTRERQQQLYRRLLDAGRTLEQEERDESGRREARAGSQSADPTAPDSGRTRGAEATRYRAPAWNELRGLTAEERRLVLEYFQRINATP